MEPSKKQHIVEIISSLTYLDETAFIEELYRQILDRSPDDEGQKHYMSRLNAGVDKLSIMIEMLLSPEATSLMRRRIGNRSIGKLTIATRLQAIVNERPKRFLAELYSELLEREPDSAGLNGYMRALANGSTRLDVVHAFLQSDEFKSGLRNRQGKSVLRRRTGILADQLNKADDTLCMGIFLGYPHKVQLDDAGIGRLVIRLVEGLLSARDDSILVIATYSCNYPETEQIFSRYLAEYPNRLWIQEFNDVTWLNSRIPADLWLVPWIGMESAMRLQKPYVLMLHDLVHLHFKEIFYQREPAFCHYLDRLVVPMAEKAAAVTFISDFIRDHEGHSFLHLPATKTFVIRPAVPAKEYEAFGVIDERRFRDMYRLDDENYVVYPAAIRLHKNHERLIDAFLSFFMSEAGRKARVRLVLTDNFIGSPMEQEIRQVLNRYPEDVRRSIVFVGRIPADHIPSLYQHSIGCIIPTLFEGAGLPILESLTMNTPVAMSDLPVIREVIQDTSGFIFFNPYAVEEISAAIAQLIERHDILLPMQKFGMQKTLARTSQEVAREFYGLAKSLISR